MRQTLFLILATTLIKADIKNELRKKRKQQRPQRLEHLYLNDYLMRDIGLQPGGFAIGEKFSPSVKAKRSVRYLRYLHQLKINT
ncbi:DUF1127 domain-containing protein [Psychromonas sp. Urea-02u-13]|uniref:DUF1127 domain-containing protein n=1 Tax=Psychromonas sp. Urea-02u-13 TaxID=2058326 RepID=UPI000C324AD1|nr:DUF1127 domain-containing protein [Psychromonas sp. Urea-02u-13]PKG39046.1 DUF1127 domain-containing protein [Psychromonas sp. Urea-02u-13]